MKLSFAKEIVTLLLVFENLFKFVSLELTNIRSSIIFVQGVLCYGKINQSFYR